jgi:hypothetical protein
MRVPFAPDFHAFAEAGRQLADPHVGYEQLQPWDQLDYRENRAVPFTYHVERMRLNKDKTALKVNDSLTIGNIPPEVFEYRIGNRSALEWVIDQDRITEDPRPASAPTPTAPTTLNTSSASSVKSSASASKPSRSPAPCLEPTLPVSDSVSCPTSVSCETNPNPVS